VIKGRRGVQPLFRADRACCGSGGLSKCVGFYTRPTVEHVPQWDSGAECSEIQAEEKQLK